MDISDCSKNSDDLSPMADGAFGFDAEMNYIQNCKNEGKQSVVIIGGGPCGILSTRYISQNSNVLCVEGKSDLGGLWHTDEYTEDNHPSLNTDAYYREYGVLQSSLYENLICNGNKCMMAFKGTPPKREYDEYMKSSQFWQYLSDYATLHNIRKNVAFNTFVSSVRLAKNLTDVERDDLPFELTKRFLIELVSSNQYPSQIRYIQADYVVVATGHYSVPNYPKVASRELFTGDVSHMHYYRKSKIQKYANKHLVIVGAGLSSQDVCFILLKKSGELKPSKITVLGKKNLIEAQAQGESYVKEIQSGQLVFKDDSVKEYLSSNSIKLQSGEILTDVDNILYATGYENSYPFLEKNSAIDNIIEFYSERRNSFGPLYKRMISVNEPHLLFLGTVHTAFQLQSCLERQAIIAQRIIEGIVTLPSQTEMLASFKEDFEEAQTLHPDGRYYLKVTLREDKFNSFKYTQELQKLAQIPFDEEFENMYKNIIYPIYCNIAQKGNYAILKTLDYKELVSPDYAPQIGLF